MLKSGDIKMTVTDLREFIVKENRCVRKSFPMIKAIRKVSNEHNS